MSAVRTPRAGEVWTDQIIAATWTCIDAEADVDGRFGWRGPSARKLYATTDNMIPPPEPWENPQPVEMWGCLTFEGCLYQASTINPLLYFTDTPKPFFARCRVTVTVIPGTVEKL